MAETVAARAQRTLAAWDAGADVRYERWQAMVQELLAALADAEQERDDFRGSTYEMLGELLVAHHITPDPCPGGPCVVNALLAIGGALTVAEAERDQARQDRTRLGLLVNEWRNSALKAEQARDEAKRVLVLTEDTLAETVVILQEERERAARLGALEQTARHLVACNRGEGVRAVDWAQFEATVAALDAPPRESP